jgi:hypothetical protein
MVGKVVRNVFSPHPIVQGPDDVEKKVKVTAANVSEVTDVDAVIVAERRWLPMAFRDQYRERWMSKLDLPQSYPISQHHELTVWLCASTRGKTQGGCDI